MDSKLVCIVVCALVGLSHSAFVDTLGKCSYKDDKCVGDLIESIVREASDNGIPELNIPSIDPLILSNLSVPILGFMNILIEEGDTKGVKTCVVESIHNDFHKGITNMNLNCDLTITAKVKVDGSTPFVKSLFGQDVINGNGNLKIKLDKIKITLQFSYDAIEKDGNVYFTFHEDELKSDFEIENINLSANKLFIGEQDVSEIVETFFNQNWKIIMPTFGRGIFDVAMKILIDIINKWFTKVPAQYYYTDDLSSFVKN